MASVGNGDVEHTRPSGIELARQRWWVARIVNRANQSIRVNTIASIVGNVGHPILDVDPVRITQGVRGEDIQAIIVQHLWSRPGVDRAREYGRGWRTHKRARVKE